MLSSEDNFLRQEDASFQTENSQPIPSFNSEKFLPWSFLSQNSRMSPATRTRKYQAFENTRQVSQTDPTNVPNLFETPLNESQTESVHDFVNLGGPGPGVRKRGPSTGDSPANKRFLSSQNFQTTGIPMPSDQAQAGKHSGSANSKRPSFRNPLSIVLNPKDPKANFNVISISKVLTENFPDVKIKNLQPLNTENGFLILPQTHDDSIRILDKSKWSSKFASSFEITPPKMMVSKKTKPESFCLIGRGIPTDVSTDEIKSILVETRGYQDDIHIERFVKKGERGEQIPLRLVKFVLSNKKDTTDLYVHGLKLGFAQYNVECSNTNVKPTLCFRCQQFGHFSSTCKNDPVCRFCGTSSCQSLTDIHKQCEAKYDDSKKYCANCKVHGHGSSYYKCPIFKRETELANFKTEEQLARQEQVKSALREGIPPPPPPPRGTFAWFNQNSNPPQFVPNERDFPPLSEHNGTPSCRRIPHTSTRTRKPWGTAHPALGEQIVRFTHDVLHKVISMSSKLADEKNQKLSKLADDFTKLADYYFDLSIDPDSLLQDSKNTFDQWENLNKEFFSRGQDHPSSPSSLHLSP